jgi:ATP-dependent Clp protease protease subunit
MKFDEQDEKQDKEQENEENQEEVSDSEEQQKAAEIMSLLMPEAPPADLRLTGIYGDVAESRCSEVVYGLMSLTSATRSKLDKVDSDSEEVEPPDPIDFIVSTHGGSAAEMFAVYDLMRDMREHTPIHTKGLGKVMSAGVLLLAAGTKGERRIGEFCRIMIHGVVAGQHGYIADMEHEFKETKYIQKMYVKALARETKMSEAHIRKLMNKKTNVYLDAEEAVKLGIADIIF